MIISPLPPLATVLTLLGVLSFSSCSLPSKRPTRADNLVVIPPRLLCKIASLAVVLVPSEIASLILLDAAVSETLVTVVRELDVVSLGTIGVMEVILPLLFALAICLLAFSAEALRSLSLALVRATCSLVLGSSLTAPVFSTIVSATLALGVTVLTTGVSTLSLPLPNTRVKKLVRSLDSFANAVVVSVSFF